MLTAWNRRSLRSEQLAFRLSPHRPLRRRRNPEVQRWPPKDDVVFNAVVTPGAMWRWTNTDSWTRVTAACRRLARLGATDVGNLGLSQLAPKKKSPIKPRNFLGQQTCVSQLAPFLFLEKLCIPCIMECQTHFFWLLQSFSCCFIFVAILLSLPPLSLLSLLCRCPLRSLCCRWWSSLLWSSSLSCCCCYRYSCCCCRWFAFAVVDACCCCCGSVVAACVFCVLVATLKKIIIFAKISLLLTSRC